MPHNTPDTSIQFPGQNRNHANPENDDALDRRNDHLRGNPDSRNHRGGDEEE